MKKITILYTDDWEAVYHGDKCIDQGHSCDLARVLKELGYKVEQREVELNPYGACSYPNTLTELGEEK